MSHDWMESILKLIVSNTLQTTLISAESGPLLARARNSLCQRFLESTDHEYLLMTDTDVQFEPSHVHALIKADSPIAGALYNGYFKGEENAVRPTAMDKDDEGIYRSIDTPEASDKPISVGAVGMGLTLIKREVLETLTADLTKAWPFAEAVIDGRALGEDVTFCSRALEKGFTTVVVPEATIGHRKTFLI